MNYDEFEEEPYEYCPKCGRYLDEVDHEYQSCSKCGYDIVSCEFNTNIKREPTQDDFMSGDADILTGCWY